jgi:DNA-directed RNA polymerase specialized sigma24 family protein
VAVRRTADRDHRFAEDVVQETPWTVSDIAEELDIPAGTMKSRLHYGLRALRLALQERGVTKV